MFFLLSVTYLSLQVGIPIANKIAATPPNNPRKKAIPLYPFAFNKIHVITPHNIL